MVVFAVNRFRGWLTRPALTRWLERVTGAVLLAFAVRLALDPPPDPALRSGDVGAKPRSRNGSDAGQARGARVGVGR